MGVRRSKERDWAAAEIHGTGSQTIDVAHAIALAVWICELPEGRVGSNRRNAEGTGAASFQDAVTGASIDNKTRPMPIYHGFHEHLVPGVVTHGDCNIARQRRDPRVLLRREDAVGQEKRRRREYECR